MRSAKKAGGTEQGRIRQAEGEVFAIKRVHEAASQYFVGNAQRRRRPEAVEKPLASNARIVVPSDSEPANAVGELAGVLR